MKYYLWRWSLPREAILIVPHLLCPKVTKVGVIRKVNVVIDFYNYNLQQLEVLSRYLMPDQLCDLSHNAPIQKEDQRSGSNQNPNHLENYYRF